MARHDRHRGRCTRAPQPSPSCCADTTASSRGACARARSRRPMRVEHRRAHALHRMAVHDVGPEGRERPRSIARPRPAARRRPRGTPVAARAAARRTRERVSPWSDLRDDVVAGDTGRQRGDGVAACSAAAPRAPRRRAPRRRAPRVATGWRPSAPARRRTLQARDRPGADRSHRRSPCHHRCASACWPTPSTTPVGSGATCARSSPRAVVATTSSSWSPRRAASPPSWTWSVPGWRARSSRRATTRSASRSGTVTAPGGVRGGGRHAVIGCKHLVPRTRMPTVAGRARRAHHHAGRRELGREAAAAARPVPSVARRRDPAGGGEPATRTRLGGLDRAWADKCDVVPNGMSTQPHDRRTARTAGTRRPGVRARGRRPLAAEEHRRA